MYYLCPNCKAILVKKSNNSSRGGGNGYYFNTDIFYNNKIFQNWNSCKLNCSTFNDYIEKFIKLSNKKLDIVVLLYGK